MFPLYYRHSNVLNTIVVPVAKSWLLNDNNNDTIIISCIHIKNLKDKTRSKKTKKMASIFCPG